MRSMPTSSKVIAMTGVPRMKMMLVAYCAQTKRGKRNQVMPGARMVCTVTIKFKPVRMEEKPLMKTPMTAGGRGGSGEKTAGGGGKKLEVRQGARGEGEKTEAPPPKLRVVWRHWSLRSGSTSYFFPLAC